MDAASLRARNWGRGGLGQSAVGRRDVDTNHGERTQSRLRRSVTLECKRNAAATAKAAAAASAAAGEGREPLRNSTSEAAAAEASDVART